MVWVHIDIVHVGIECLLNTYVLNLMVSVCLQDHYALNDTKLLDQIFFLRSSRNKVDLLSYESKTTDKRGQYDWKAEKNLDGYLYVVPIEMK